MIGRLIELLSGSLDPEEREAVLGDLAESGGADWRAMRDVFGLWMRRQAILWRLSPAPWLALFGLILPFGILLGAISLWVSDFAAPIWAYGNHWGVPDLASFFVGFNLFGDFAWLTPLMLSSWSWSVGYAVGSVSPRAAQFNTLLLVLALTAGEFSLALAHRTRQDPHYSAIFHEVFYRLIFPLVVHALCVLTPAVAGLRSGTALRGLRPEVRAFAITGTVLTLATIAIQTWAWLEFSSAFGQPGLWDGWPGGLFQLISLWPVVYGLSFVMRRAADGANL